MREYTNFTDDNGNLIKDYIVIDVETTGLSPILDKITEIGAVKVRNFKVTDEFQTLINIHEEVPEFITKLTGITTEMLETKGIEPKEAFKKLKQFIGKDIIIGHNVSFDTEFIDNAFKTYIGETLNNDCFDTLEKSREMINISNHKLGTMAWYFNIEQTDSHRALNDAHVTNELYKSLYDRSVMIEHKNKCIDNIVNILSKEPLEKLVEIYNRHPRKHYTIYKNTSQNPKLETENTDKQYYKERDKYCYFETYDYLDNRPDKIMAYSFSNIGDLTCPISDEFNINKIVYEISFKELAEELIDSYQNDKDTKIDKDIKTLIKTYHNQENATKQIQDKYKGEEL